MKSTAIICLFGACLLHFPGFHALSDVATGLGETMNDLTEILPDLKVKVETTKVTLASLEQTAKGVVNNLSVEGANADLKLILSGLKVKVENVRTILPELKDAVDDAIDKLPIFGNSFVNFPAKILLRATVGALNTLLSGLTREATELTNKLMGDLTAEMAQIKEDSGKVGDLLSKMVDKVSELVSNLPNLDVEVGDLPAKLEAI